MFGFQRNFTGCLTLLFVAGLLLGAAWVVLGPTAPLPEKPVVPTFRPDKSDPKKSSQAQPGNDSDAHRAHSSRTATDAPADQGTERPEPTPNTEPTAEPTGDGPALRFTTTRVDNVTVRDREGQVVFQGTVDLAPTLARISAGERLSWEHDGTVFSNRERRLPLRQATYYHEYVHPTPGLDGPGPQRVVVGGRGEVYYTPDHYLTWQRLP